MYVVVALDYPDTHTCPRHPTRVPVRFTHLSLFVLDGHELAEAIDEVTPRAPGPLARGPSVQTSRLQPLFAAAL